MSKIIGVTVGTTLPKPNFKQTDPTKGDYIKNKPDFDGLKSKVEQIEVRVDTMQESAYDDTELRGIVSENVAKIDTLNELVGNTKVETQISDAVATLESEIDGKFSTMQSEVDSKVDAEDGKGLSTNDYTTAEKDKLATVEDYANFYEHPTHDSHDLGLYKVTVDDEGHVSDVALVEKEDIVALGIPAQDTTYDEEISDLSDRIDDVENSINTTNETLNGVVQDFESYKTTNNEAVSTNASGIEANKTAIEEIQGDYLKSTDRTQLQDGINEVSEKATANASAIEILNGEGDGSVKQSIDNAFNEFAANVTNDDVVNTYKELIDYAAKHGPEFTELVGKVDTIDTHVGEVEVDLSNYKTAVSDQFTEVNTTINNHVTDRNNPHGVTKEQVGLDNVDNTSDLEKPISNAVQKALDGKANLTHAHSDLYYDKDEIEELVTVEDIDDICGSNVIIGGGDANVVSYATKQWVQDGYQPKGNYLTSVPDGYATESYVNTKIAAIPTPDVSGQINTHNLSTDAHNDIRLLVDGLTTRLNTLADCDDATLDQMSEVVEYIKSNQSLIDGVTTKKVNVADIIDNLTTNVSNKPLSAAQGVVLKSLIDELTSSLSNYQPKGDYLTAIPAGYATEEFVTAKIAEAELGGEEVDLSEYVTESEMQNYAQPKGDYLTSIPSEYITEKELENKGYLTEHQSLEGLATEEWVEEKFEEHSGFVAQPEAPEDINVLWLDTDDDNAGSGGNVENGEDGFSPIATVTQTDSGAVISITDKSGTTTATITNGKDGKTPVCGVDYYTEADKSEFSEYIATELAKRGQLKPEFANSVDECTDTTKLYVLPDGFIYAYLPSNGPAYTNVLDEVGYSENVRISTSSGYTEQTASGYDLTGYVPLKVGDVVRMQNITIPNTTSGYDSTFYSFDTNKNGLGKGNVGYLEMNGANPVWTDGYLTEFTVVSWLFCGNVTEGYIRFGAGNVDDTSILTINEEITEGSGGGYDWASTGHAFVPADYEDRIVILENKTTAQDDTNADFEERISAVENYDISGLPNYAIVERNRVRDTLYEKLILGNVAIIGFSTDQHISKWANMEESTNTTGTLAGLRALRSLTHKIPFNAVVLGGDYVTGGSVQSIQTETMMVFEQLTGAACPVVGTAGNHDSWQNDNTVTDGDIFKSHTAPAVMKYHRFVNLDTVSANGYIDDPTTSLRYIILDAEPREDGSTNLKTTITANLTAMLNSMPSGYNAVVFSHKPLNDSLGNGFKDAVDNKSVLESNANKIICCINGHGHLDASATSNGVLYIQTTCAGIDRPNDAYDRTAGTVNETVFDVFVIDQTLRKIYAIRYGAGSDREFSY